MSLLKHRKNKESLTAEEQKALEKLLRAAHPYCSDLNLTLLLPKHRLPLPLDGDTPEERMEELIHKCSEIFEAVMASDDKPMPAIITRRFINWFVQVFRTEFPMQQMQSMLNKVMKKGYRRRKKCRGMFR